MRDHYSDYTIKWATLDWEIEEAFALRRQVFCGEQGIFQNDDRDEIDDYAQVLVAIANRGGWHERIVGTVRIHPEENKTWWGSRLAVEREFRTFAGLGSTLIKLAVSSAHGLGCEKFLAQVQKRNEKLFQKLNWQSKYETQVKDHPHVMMEAELSQFPPCFQPKSGFVIHTKPPVYEGELAPPLMSISRSRLSTVAKNPIAEKGSELCNSILS